MFGDLGLPFAPWTGKLSGFLSTLPMRAISSKQAPEAASAMVDGSGIVQTAIEWLPSVVNSSPASLSPR